MRLVRSLKIYHQTHLRGSRYWRHLFEVADNFVDRDGKGYVNISVYWNDILRVSFLSCEFKDTRILSDLTSFIYLYRGICKSEAQMFLVSYGQHSELPFIYLKIACTLFFNSSLEFPSHLDPRNCSLPFPLASVAEAEMPHSCAVKLTESLTKNQRVKTPTLMLASFKFVHIWKTIVVGGFIRANFAMAQN